MFGFQRLEIYSLGKEIVKDIYGFIKRFPSEEKYALALQMSRSAVSIPSNIAEGTSRKSSKDKAYFINIAYGSLMELICQMEISLELGYIAQKEYDEFAIRAKNLAVKLSNYVAAITKQ